MAGITLTIEVDDKGTVKVKQFADESKKAFDQMQAGPQAAQGPLASLQESWVGLTAKVAAATAVVYGIGRAFASFVNEAAEAEQIENRLKFALETTGYSWQYAKTAVDQFAVSIQETTRFSDEQARQALTDMMMYTNDFAKAQMGAKLAMDMSIRTGQDLGSTSRLIGMAMSGNVEMLGRYIPQLRNLDAVLGENATMADKAAYAMKILNEKFGGTAQADVDSYSGKVAQFKNAWGDFKETIGDALVPALKNVFEWLTKIINLFKQFNPETASQAMTDATINKFRGRIEELRGILAQSGLAPFQKDMITNQIGALEEGIRRAEEAIRKETLNKEALAKQTRTDIFLPGGDKAKTKEEDPLAAWNALILKANEWGEVVMGRQELAELGWTKQDDIVAQVTAELARLERESNEWGEITVARQGLVEAGWDGVAKAEADVIREGIENARLLHQAWLEGYTKVCEWEGIWESVGQNISSAWASNMVNIVRGTESMSQKIKSFFQSIGDVFLSTVSKMIAQWLIFGSVTGKKEEGGGWLSGGLWSGLLGALFHGGGIVPHEGGTRSVPAAAFAFAPRLHSGFMPDEYPAVLKKGEGVFTPGQMKALGGPAEGGQQATVIMYIEATDVDSFERKYGGSVTKIIHKNKKSAMARN